MSVKCPEGQADTELFVLESVAEKSFLVKLTVGFSGKIPTKISHAASPDLHKQYKPPVDYDLSAAMSEGARETVKDIPAIVGDVVQFVCRSDPAKKNEYQRLLAYNSRLVWPNGREEQR